MLEKVIFVDLVEVVENGCIQVVASGTGGNIFISLASQNLGSTIGAGKPGALISALSFRQPVPHATPVTYQISLPTQTFTAYLRHGDVYYDTSANNVLKVIP